MLLQSSYYQYRVSIIFHAPPEESIASDGPQASEPWAEAARLLFGWKYWA
ncbi:MAG TPA: hypothetical protein VGX92_04440 [Pyrinomonadaceae bacterium]|nr:hypothetical protein [Pyrinomonadaceae bacterium]